jgi:hypothetical protein
MNKEEFDKKTKAAAKEFASKKKVASQPETQFTKGALWAWELLMRGQTLAEYESQYRADVMDREDKVDAWKESLIHELAEMKAERDEMMAEINRYGRLMQKLDRNMNEYYESNPLYVHVKALDQTISVWRDKLGLSNTVNPDRIKQKPKDTVDESDPMVKFITGGKK